MGIANRVLKNNILVQAQGGRLLKSAVYILIYEHLKKPSNAVIGPIEQFFKTLLRGTSFLGPAKKPPPLARRRQI
jgi:hypothetical protein